ELAWVFSDFKLGRDNQQVNDFGDVAHLGGGGRLGNLLALNGRPTARRIEVRAGERIRLRLLNASTARIFLIAFENHEPFVVSYDGQPIEPHGLPGGALALGPGMRTDLILDCTGVPGDTFSVLDRRDKGAELVRVTYSKKPPVRTRRLPPPEPIAPNPLPEPDLSKAVDHFVLFEGGLLGKPAIGLADGRPRKLHEIMTASTAPTRARSPGASPTARNRPCPPAGSPPPSRSRPTRSPSPTFPRQSTTSCCSRAGCSASPRSAWSTEDRASSTRS